MQRRALFLLAGLGALTTTGCGPRTTAEPAASASATPRAATADDYLWFEGVRDLSRGFCFTWIKNLRTPQVLARLGSTELERVTWQQLVGSGDGQRGRTDRDYAGIAKVNDHWMLMVEDNGRLGATDKIAQALSLGTTLISHYQSADGHGRYLVMQDQATQLDFDPLTPNLRTGPQANTPALLTELRGAGFSLTPPTTPPNPIRNRNQAMESAFALTERQTTIPMTTPLLQTLTYALTAVPHPN